MQLPICRSILLFMSALWCLSACVTTSNNTIPDRPFRTGVMRLNLDLDEVKPLGMADYSGWVVGGDILVGAISANWVAGIKLPERNVQWWLEVPQGLAAPATVVKDWVMLGQRDGTLMKVELATGDVVWTANLDTFSARKFNLSGTTLLAQTTSQQLYALDFETGSVRWIYDGGFPEGLNLQGSAAPVVSDDTVITSLASGELLGVSLLTGKLLWRFDPELTGARFHDVMGEMVVRSDGILLARYDGLVAKISVQGVSRNVLWKEMLPSVSATSFHSGRFYVGCTNGQVFAFEASSGRRIWTADTAQAVTTIVPGERLVYVSGGDGRINALTAQDGVLAWHDDIAGNIVRDPIFFSGALYYATGLKNLYGYKVF